MRIIDKKEDISYDKTLDFFNNRAQHNDYKNPYSVTMYQDNNPNLVEKRNKLETETLLQYVNLNEKTTILDIACGIGRWADCLPSSIESYYGIDFSDGLIKLANERNKKDNFHFYVSSIKQTEHTAKNNNFKKINIVLMIGILVYINDEDLLDCLQQIEKVCDENCRIIIREPIGLTNRLTLKDFYSEDLQANYNAIYRTRKELINSFENTFFKKGFKIIKEDFLFSENSNANNRKETAQYYFVLERAK